MQSNKYNWNQYESVGKDGSTETFTVRSLKQGCTGAVRTWPVAPVLLDYLVLRNGLHPNDEQSSNSDPLDMTSEDVIPSMARKVSDNSHYNIIELGAGTGYLGIALALSMNHGITNNQYTENDNSARYPKLRIMCTDHDSMTLKNMRYNVHEQPKERMIGKAVRVHSLCWDNNIGGSEFSNAVDSQFGSKGTTTKQDPLRLVTHLIGSDVHFGTNTLEPLSSVISAFKLRAPSVIVVVMVKERSPEFFADVSQLKSKIEAKVERGRVCCSEEDQLALENFTVTVRDVLHRDVANMKLIEC